MAKYLIIDSALLNGRWMLKDDITDDDLIFRGEGGYGFFVLENGVHIVDALNTLVSDHGYQIILNSEDKIVHRELLGQLQKACQKKEWDAPKIHAIATYDSHLLDISSNRPIVTSSSLGCWFIFWGKDNLSAKTSSLRALEAARELDINENNRRDHIVFDSNADNLKTFEGYQTHRITDEFPLDDALKHVLENLESDSQNNQNKKQSVGPHENNNSYARAIQRLNQYITPKSPKAYNFWTKKNHEKNVKIAENLLANIQDGNISKATVFKSKCTPWFHTIRSNTLKGIFQETEASFKQDHPEENKGIFSCFK